MRNQFYGDRKDVLKWTLTLRNAGDRTILYAAMLRPNKGDHGSDFRAVSDSDPSVAAFFEAERRKFVADSSKRSVLRIDRLSPSICLVPKVYRHGERLEYFSEVLHILAASWVGKGFLVLIDPDNGIAGKCPKAEHVCAEQIEAIWSVLGCGDVLLVYQHQYRDREWVEKKRSALADAIDVSEELISAHCYGDVCFFKVER